MDRQNRPPREHSEVDKHPGNGHRREVVYIDEGAPYIAFGGGATISREDSGPWPDLPVDRNAQGVLEVKGGPARAVLMHLGIHREEWEAMSPPERRKAAQHATAISIVLGALREIVLGDDDNIRAKADELLDRVGAIVQKDADFPKGYQFRLSHRMPVGKNLYRELLYLLQSISTQIPARLNNRGTLDAVWAAQAVQLVNDFLVGRNPIAFAPKCTSAHIESLCRDEPTEVTRRLMHELMPRLTIDALGRLSK